MNKNERQFDTNLKEYLQLYLDGYSIKGLSVLGSVTEEFVKKRIDKFIANNEIDWYKLCNFKEYKEREFSYYCKHKVFNPMQNKEVVQKVSNTQKERQDEYKKQNQEKYGVDYPTQLPEVIDKINKTKDNNGTHNTSLEEDRIYALLCRKFTNVKRQYSSKTYPFKCDFYILDIDMYIEYNGSWTHGGFPYEDNEISKSQLKTWQTNSIKSKYYLNAINTWTIRDVKKRECAKINKLNWIEFFTMKEFLDWYEKL